LDPDAISTDNFFLNEVTGAVRYPSTHEAVIIDENTILAMRTIGQTRMTMQKLDNIDALVTEIAPRLKAEYGTVTDEAITEAQKDLDAVCREQECQGSICIAGRPSQALIRQERSDLNENKADLDSCSKIANSDISQATKTQAKILQKLGEMLDVLDTESKKTLPTGVYNPNEPSTEL
jgi:transcriptional regulator with PAS, ATPase and Fis domain